MLERFSARARLAVEHAEAEARRLRHPHVGTEHLLLGLLCDQTTPAAATLMAAGVALDLAREKVSEAVGPATATGATELAFTARARRALERAGRFSVQHRQAEIGTQHVLFGVLDVEGTAGQVLRGLGVDVARLREAVDLGRADDAVAAEPSAPPNAGPDDRPVAPRCPSCGTDVEGGLMHRLMTSRGDGAGDRRLVVVSCAACGCVLGIT